MVLSVVSYALTLNQCSLISPTVPLPNVTEAVSVMTVPDSPSTFSELSCSRAIEVMFSSARVLSSPLSVIPLLFASTHTLRSPNTASSSLITPSSFSSSSLSASKPEDDLLPFAMITLSPKSSLPLSIILLPFLSRARKPSSPVVQEVFSAVPLLSRSKYTPLSAPLSFMPLSPRSMISGSRFGSVWSASSMSVSLSFLPLSVVSPCQSPSPSLPFPSFPSLPPPDHLSSSP